MTKPKSTRPKSTKPRSKTGEKAKAKSLTKVKTKSLTKAKGKGKSKIKLGSRSSSGLESKPRSASKPGTRSKPTSRRRRREPFAIADFVVKPGTKKKLELPIARLMSGTPVALTILVVHGKQAGPTVWLSAAMHGDELCGIEIIRRVLKRVDPRSMAGTIIAVPVVNVHGFNRGDRYLPDRRDLNRCFPGSPRGSLASRIAHLMMTQVIARCSVGIDLHTGSDHRINLPQIRADLDDPKTLELAQVFAAPVAIHSRTRDGSLRQAATEAGSVVLLYEAGEADRFDRHAIEAGTAGVLRVLDRLGIVRAASTPSNTVWHSRKTRWFRATKSGIVHLTVALGQEVTKGDVVAKIYDPFGRLRARVTAKAGGLVIGHTQRPLVNRGDAILHVAGR